MIPYDLQLPIFFYDLDVVISVGDRDNDLIFYWPILNQNDFKISLDVVISVGDRDNDISLRIGNVIHNNKIMIPYY